MIRTSASQRVDGKYIILPYEPMREDNAFYMIHILLILRLEPMEYFYTKLSDAIVYRFTKQASMCVSDYRNTLHHNI